MTTIVVSGAIANKYRNGGAAWTRLSWILGFKKLGCTVYFVEQIERQHCVDPAGSVTAFEESVNLAYFKRIAEQFGLADSAALVYENGEAIAGISRQKLLDAADAADLLVNISGHLTWPPLMRCLRRKAYVDLDPGFTQFWHASGNAGPRLGRHDVYFTVGANVGSAGCPIPTDGIHWRPTRQPVVLTEWPFASDADGGFTTIASWRGPYGPVQFGGKTFGLKVHEFRKFVELPQQTRQSFEIALDIHRADSQDRESLRRHGWQIVNPKAVAPDPISFRRYVQRSRAEFSAAQGIYVETESGWFSDRTVRYLASGKPALVQDTGFSRHYPVGEGLIPFRTLEQAIAGAREIAEDYARHCLAARALAETYFDSDKVLSRFLEEAGVTT